MLKFKQFLMEIPTSINDVEPHDAKTRLQAFFGHLRAPTHMNGASNYNINESFCNDCYINEITLNLPNRHGASDSTSHIGTRNHESNDSIIADHLNASPRNIAALVHADEGENTATHVYDHKHNRFYKIHNGDDDDAIEQNEDGSSGGVRGLKMKLSSGDAKKKAETGGAFVHHSSANPVPDHPDGKGIKRVLELNAATHRFGRELPDPLEGDKHREKRKQLRQAQHAQVARPPSMAHHPAMNGGTEKEVNQYHRIHEAGHQLSQEFAANGETAHGRIRAGYSAVTEKLKQEGYDPRKDRAATKAANAADKAHQKEHGFAGQTPRNFTGNNTKIKKTAGLGDITVGVSGAPAHTHGMSGTNNCPESSHECRDNCLGFSTGKNAMLSNLISKMSKSQFQAKHPEHHAHKLVCELLNHVDAVHEHNKELEAAKQLKKGQKRKVRITGNDLFGAVKPGSKIQGEHHGHLVHDGNGNVTFVPAKGHEDRDAPEPDKLDASWRPNMYTDHPPSVMRLHDIHNYVRKYAAARGINFTTRDYTKNPGTLKQKHPEGYYIAASSTGPDVRRG